MFLQGSPQNGGNNDQVRLPSSCLSPERCWCGAPQLSQPNTALQWRSLPQCAPRVYESSLHLRLAFRPYHSHPLLAVLAAPPFFLTSGPALRLPLRPPLQASQQPAERCSVVTGNCTPEQWWAEEVRDHASAVAHQDEMQVLHSGAFVSRWLRPLPLTLLPASCLPAACLLPASCWLAARCQPAYCAASA